MAFFIQVLVVNGDQKPWFLWIITAQKMKFPIKDFFSKCDQIHSFLQIWSYLLKKSLMENFIFLKSTTEWVQTWQIERNPNGWKVYADSTNWFSTCQNSCLFYIANWRFTYRRYDFALKWRFQSNYLERRFGQYQQMSGGRFLVGLRDSTSPKKIRI